MVFNLVLIEIITKDNNYYKKLELQRSIFPYLEMSFAPLDGYDNNDDYLYLRYKGSQITEYIVN